MTATLNDVNSNNEKKPRPSAEEAAAVELVGMAKEQGLSLTGRDGLLKLFTKNVLETALNEEMTEHLGHEKNPVSDGRESVNVRNGTRSKTVLTETSGHVTIDSPRDRDGTFEPQIVKKRHRWLAGVDEIVFSLYAKGLTTGEISAHFYDIYGASVSKETISRITDKAINEMTEWVNRALESVMRRSFPEHFVQGGAPVDAIVVKIRDGQVAKRPIYAAIGVKSAGEKDVLGLWARTGGEGTKFWMSVLTEMKNRGVTDTFFLVCDGLKGLSEVVGNVWPLTTVQTCIIHLIRNTFRWASKKDWDALKRDVKPIYSAVNADAAKAALDKLTEKWGKKYGAIVRLRESAWEESIPFLDFDVEIRKVICSTNAIVIPSDYWDVFDVQHDGVECAGRGYLQSVHDRYWLEVRCSCEGWPGRGGKWNRGRCSVTMTSRLSRSRSPPQKQARDLHHLTGRTSPCIAEAGTEKEGAERPSESCIGARPPGRLGAIDSRSRGDRDHRSCVIPNLEFRGDDREVESSGIPSAGLLPVGLTFENR